jgi:hypothetical protein
MIGLATRRFCSDNRDQLYKPKLFVKKPDGRVRLCNSFLK